MNIKKKKIDDTTIEAQISLEVAELAPALERAQENLAKNLTLKGFRKGKAPKDVAKKNLDDAAVRAEGLQVALEESFDRAVHEQGWEVMRTDDLKVKRNDDSGLEYTIAVTLWPTVTLPDLTAITVKRKKISVTDAEIAESLDTIRNMRATFLDKTGPAAEGDRVEVDFESSIAGTPVAGGSSKNHPLVIGGKTFMPGFEEQLVGLATGDTRTFTLTAPADYYEPKLAGKAIEFSVTMNKVQAVLKPAADDAFAQSLGKFASLDVLQQHLREGLEREKQEKEDQRLRLEILDAVLAQATIPAPKKMTEQELDRMVARFGHDLTQRGMELPMYLARMNKTEVQLRDDWKEQAERQVRISLVLRQVIKEKGLGVNPEELEAATTEAMGEMMRAGQGSPEQVDTARLQQMLAERIVTAKALEFLENTCTAA